jgi:hypothetical protein
MSTSSSQVLRTAKTALKFQWASHKIDEFVSTLDRLRNSLTLATLLALRKNSKTSNAEVLTHLLKIQDDCQYHGLNTTRTQDTIEALSTSIQNRTEDAFQTIQGLYSACLEEIRALRHDNISSEKNVGREVEILEWLDFRQIFWRYHAIDKVYEDTYEWIFHPPSEQNPWSDFVAHLQNDSMDPYFINGKAGSGKSTLMKFVQTHRTTRTLLERWAGSKKLAVSHFYFWNLGTSLQKTHTGLLRALLHSILEQYPELIPAVFPKLYCARARLDEDCAPQYIELKEAFALMVKKSNFMRIAIFIDGIDEFDGDHQDMATFLRSLSSTDLKLVVSSRPLNACLGALDGCPSLRLQDLTRPDMKHYVHEKLSFHPLMIQSPEQASLLTTELMDKADGVFLWVVITVRLLIKGFEDGDNLDELQQTLRSLPPDLKSLYRRMFDTMDPHYRRQGSELFQLTRKWYQLRPDEEFPAIAAFYATQNPSVGLEVKSGMASSNNDKNVGSLERRLRSRCCGLLEVRIFGTLDESVVTYMHRTVGEFLTLDEVWEEVCGITNGTGFEPTLNLASACLAVVKTSNNSLSGATLKKYIMRATAWCGKSTTLTPQMAHKFVTELYMLCPTITAKRYEMRPAMASLFTGELESIHIFAAQTRIVQYYLSDPFLVHLAQSDGNLRHLHHSESYRERYNITVQALHSWDWARMEWESWDLGYEGDARTLSHLLTHIMSPDDATHGRPLWLAALKTCESMEISDRSTYSTLLLLVTFLQASSDSAVLCQQALEYRHQGHIRFDLEAFLQKYKEGSHANFDEEDVKLFRELKRLATPHNPVESTKKKQPRSKKRKTKGHQSENKRRQ